MNDLESAIFPLPEIRDCKCEDHTGYEAFHGTVSGYTHHRCDCLDCQMAIRAYIALPRNRAKQQQANASRAHARRARATDAMCEPYTRLRVAERDNWICFCGGTIDSSLRWPNPWSFSIDHVVPIGAGGSDTFRNVRSSHLCCNMKRPKPRRGEQR